MEIPHFSPELEAKPKSYEIENTDAITVAGSLEDLENGAEYPAAIIAPETYPGKSPDFTGNLLIGNQLHELAWNENSKRNEVNGAFNPVIMVNGEPKNLNEYLLERNLPSMERRYAVIGFGSNRCPGQNSTKFDGVLDSEGNERKDLGIIPSFKGTMDDMAVVFAAKPGLNGYFFANAYKGPETEGAQTEVVVQFLTEEQLALMHKTEPNYLFTELDTVRLGLSVGQDYENKNNGVEMPALFYAGQASIYTETSEDGEQHPIVMPEVPSVGHDLNAMTQIPFTENFFAAKNDPEGKKAAVLKKYASSIDDTDEQKFRELLRSSEKAGGVNNKEARQEVQAALMAAMSPSEQVNWTAMDDDNIAVRRQSIADFPTFGETMLAIEASQQPTKDDAYAGKNLDARHQHWTNAIRPGNMAEATVAHVDNKDSEAGFTQKGQIIDQAKALDYYDKAA